MKKFLSLVLALVMTMSLVTVSAGAKQTFTDDAAIDYTEAVEVVKACKIIDGYADGSFNPTATLTRGAAAKIICNLILGPTTASALSADAAPYKDVPANSTFAGYIAYCAKEGIVSGYADGTFKPGATLTGYAFWKMLLGALGYDANIEGYVGSNWSISVAKRGLSDDVDLADGLSGDFDGQKAVTREEACLYVFNALQAKVASYGNTTTVTVGGTDVTVGGSKVQFVNGTFMANYFKKLDKIPAYDDAGRPATRWTYDDKEIGTYAKTPKAVFTNDAKAYKLRDAIGKLTSSDVVGFYYTINELNTTSTMDQNAGSPMQAKVKKYASSESTKLSKAFGDGLGNYVGNGVTVEVYYKKGDDTQTKIVVVDEFIGKITAVTKDDEGRLVKIGAKEFHTDDFKVGDWVLYTIEGGKIATMKAAEKLTGKITKIVKESNVATKWTIDGTEYEGHKGFTGLSSMVVGDTVDFYLDSNGYIIKAALNTASVAAENLVLFTAKKGGDAIDDARAKAIYGTGKSETVTLKEDADLMKIYRYTTDSGKIKVDNTVNDYVSTYYGASTTLGGTPSGANGDTTTYYFSKGATVIKAGKGTAVAGTNVLTKVNANTTFVLINGNGDATTYVGYKNAPQFEGATHVVTYGKQGEAAVLVYVWVADSDVSSSNSTSTYVLSKTGDMIVEKKSNGDEIKYYNVNTVDGKTLKVNVSVANTIATYKDADKPIVVVGTMRTDSDGIVTSIVNNDKMTSNSVGGDKIVKVSDGVLVIGGVDYSFADNVKVYNVNKSQDTVTEIGIDGIDESVAAYKGFTALYTNTSDGIIAELYLQNAAD